MTPICRAALPAFALTAWLSVALAAPDAAQVVARLRNARLSSGFELRLQEVEAPGSAPGAPVKLALIGRIEAASRSLAVRAIAPDAMRGQLVVVDHRPGCTRAANRSGATDPFGDLFGTGLAAWDLVSPWLDWQKQSVHGGDRVAGRECMVLRSRSDGGGPIREVHSCVDTEAGLVMRTRLFDGHGRLQRSIQVVTTMRKESGALAAKRIAISRGDRRTELEAYSGDEHYEVPADAFEIVEGTPCR
jgi:hypothetical protein